MNPSALSPDLFESDEAVDGLFEFEEGDEQYFDANQATEKKPSDQEDDDDLDLT